MTKLITIAVSIALVLAVASLIVSVVTYNKIGSDLGAITRFTGPLSSENGFIGGTASGSSFSTVIATDVFISGTSSVDYMAIATTSWNPPNVVLGGSTSTTFASPCRQGDTLTMPSISSATNSSLITPIWFAQVISSTGTMQAGFFNPTSSSAAVDFGT